MNGLDYIPLRECKRTDVLALDREAMAKMKSASLTLAAVRRLARRDGTTFARVSIIADVACRGQRSTEADLAKLVRHGWLNCKGRQNRRTQTYVMHDDLMNANCNRKFTIFPRWVAYYVNPWAARCVFAAVNSRDSLCEAIGDDDGLNFGRLEYRLVDIAKDTGLSRPAIMDAKALLVAKGLIVIDGGMRQYDGRMSPDTLCLNADFPVLKVMVSPGKKPADCPSKNLADCHLVPGKNPAGVIEETCGCECKNPSGSIEETCGCSYRESLTESSTGIIKGTAPPSADAVCVSIPEEEGIEIFLRNCRKNLSPSAVPTMLDDAVRGALARGCTLDQLRLRVAHFANNAHRWRSEHRAGALHFGLTNCRPDSHTREQWPYSQCVPA